MADSVSIAAIPLLREKALAIRAHAEPYAKGIHVSNPSIALLAGYQVRVCDALVTLITDLDTTDEEELSADLRRLFHCILRLAKLSRFFVQGESPVLQSDILVPWDDVVKKVHPDAALIIRTQSAYEFEARVEIREVFEKSLPLQLSLRDIFRGFPRYFLVFNIPAIEAWNVLHQTLLAHEIGHFIYKCQRLDDIAFAILAKHLPDIKRLFDDAFVKGLAGVASHTYEQFQEWVSGIVASRFKELMSDIFALQIVGPCIVTALRDFGLPGYSLDFTSDDGTMFLYYPSFRTRFLALLKRVDVFFQSDGSGGNGNVMTQWCEDLKQWQAALLASGPPPTSPFSTVDNIVEECVDAASEKLEGSTCRWAYDRQIFQHEVLPLYNRIVEKIPPNELRCGEHQTAPASWQSILNAAWLSYSYNSAWALDVLRFPETRQTDSDPTVRHHALLEFNEFIARSLEMAIVHRQFLNQKSTMDGVFD
jgi:hypothetical protein